MSVLAPFLVAIVVFGVLVGALYAGRAMFRKSAVRAIERAPTQISLTPIEKPKWEDAALMNNLANPLLVRGFQDVGSFSIPALPQAAMRLLCLPDDATVVAIFEHQQGGHWLEVSTYYADGTDACTTTNTVPLPQRPDHWRGHSPGTNSGAVYTLFKNERPDKPLSAVTVETAVAQFERAFGEEAEWRKKSGKPPPRLATPSGSFPLAKKR